MIKKTFAIWILILLMPTYAYAWCSSPMAPSVPSNWNKPTRPMKPSVPFCVNEWNNTHTCDEWTISSYNNDVSFYNTQLQRYNNEVEEYSRKLQYFVDEARDFANQALDYANCEIRNLD